MAKAHPRIGVAAVVRNAKGEILVGKRKGSHGSGTWQFPGGHLEYAEKINPCAERETMEETALAVKASGVIAVTNDVFEAEGKHYVTLFVHCELLNPEDQPQVMEPNKCECWQWTTWHDLKAINGAACVDGSGEKLFLPIANLLRDHPEPDRLVKMEAVGRAC